MGNLASHAAGRGLWSRNSPDKSELSRRMGRRAIGLADDLSYKEIFLHFAQEYHNLGWALTVLDNGDTPKLEIRAEDSPSGWRERLNHLLTADGPLNLGIHTGAASRLLVLEVAPAGRQLLDPLGPWRSLCIAHAGGEREHHYFRLPPGYPTPRTLALPDRTIQVFGQESLVLAPPSLARDAATPWRWLSPPWESPPPPPSPALWHYLRDILKEAAKPCPAAPHPAPAIEWGRHPLPQNAKNPRGLSPEDADALEYLKELTFNLYRQLHDSPKVAAFNAALREHLEEHPDMAADLEKVGMLQYCLYTYCRIHPDFADFTIKERVQEASRMACQFLNQLNRYLQEYGKLGRKG